MMPRALLLLICLSILAPSGCKPASSPLDASAALAASPTGGRKAAAIQLASDWAAKAVTFDEAINYANDMIESAAKGTPFLPTGTVVKSADATAFAGAVLDAMQISNAQMPKHDDTKLFWMRTGRLAFRASEEAFAAGRLPEALTLVFAGPQFWQDEGYWYMYPDHDGLAAVILAQSGRRNEAIARLSGRVELKGVAAEVYEMLRKGQ